MVLALLCLASSLAQVAAGLALASFALPTGTAALDVLAAAGGVALLALPVAAVPGPRRTPAVVRTLPSGRHQAPQAHTGGAWSDRRPREP